MSRLRAVTAAPAAPLETVSGPKQARSERTLYRLLDTAETLLAEKGLAGISIPEIARRAGSSVGGFYARFQDKDELLRALEERFFAQLSARLDALADERRWARAATATIVEAAVAELVAVTVARRHMIRAFLYRAAQDRGVREEGLRFRTRVADRMRALLLGRRAEITHPDPALAIDLGTQVAFALMQQHVLLEGTRAGGRALSEAELCREVTDIVLGYAGIRRRARRGRRTR
jgi:AcrR family transcriptional regulator